MPTRHDVSQVPLQGGYVAKQCPVRAQNDAIVPAVPVAVDPFQQRLFDHGNSYEAEVIAGLLTAHPETVVIEGGGEMAEASSLAAMASGAPLVLNARLRDEAGRRIGKPDLLVRAEGGGFHPIDIKWHRVLDPATPTGRSPAAVISSLVALRRSEAVEDPTLTLRRHEDDALQLAHYCRILESVGHVATDPQWGGIIGTDGVVAWHDLGAPIWRTPSVTAGTKVRTTMERYDFEFEFRLDIIARAMEHVVDPDAELLVVPVRCSECVMCPWRDYCGPILEMPPGDVSLIPRVGWKEWRFHRDRGVTNRAELAHLDVSSVSSRYAGMNPSTLGEHIDQARAAMGSESVYRRRGLDAVDVLRADIEVDVDMESTEAGCYLWGTLLTDRTDPSSPTSSYQAFATWEPLGEEVETRNSVAFWDWLREVRDASREQGFSFAAYCWSASAENQYLRRFARIAGLVEDVETFIASGHWVDLRKSWDDKLITGHGSGLKLVASLTGFQWSVEDPGGGESMLRYDAAMSGDLVAQEWLLAYNRGDVEATLAVREWMSATPVASIEEA